MATKTLKHINYYDEIPANAIMELSEFGVPALLRCLAALVEEKWSETEEDLPGAEAQKAEAIRRLLALSEWFAKIS